MSTLVQEAPVRTNTYSIDTAHSRLGFVVKHLGFSKVRGAFEDFEGTVEFNPADPHSLRASAVIDAKSVNTNEKDRDEHLRSEDFFHVDEYPTITFESTNVRVITDEKLIIEGDFTLHGVTKSIELDAEFLGQSKDPWGGTRVGFEGRTSINRKEFGLNWNVAIEAGGFLVGENVDIVLEIQAVLQDD